MLRSLYTAGTGMFVQRSKMDVITNNLTNIDTSGFKRDVLLTRSFEDVLTQRLNDPSSIPAEGGFGTQNMGLYIDEVYTSFLQGPLEATDEMTDFALTQPGFFVVTTPDGPRYTRSGNFNVDTNGDLVTQEGYYVQQSGGGKITVGKGAFFVGEDGAIIAGGKNVGKLRVANFEDTTGLRKTGDNLFMHYQNQEPTDVKAPGIVQNMLEASNVDMGREVVEMMMCSRVYESNQRMVTMIDQTLDKTVNELGRF